MLIGLVGAPAALAQAPAPSPPGVGPTALRVFLDCVNVQCDFDYFRTEITFVDYVRDRKDSEIHILITGQGTGGGGREHTLGFIGIGRFAGRDDELKYVSRQTDTDDEVRQGLARTIKMGLVRYVAATDLADALQIQYRPPGGTTQAQSVNDPWNFWVFRGNMNANVNGEQRSTNSSMFGSFSANRTTETWKVRLSVNGNYRENRFELSSGETFVSITRGFNANTLVVRSLTDHWSAALRARASSSTFVNQDLATSVAPGIEFNVFPYAESTRRQFTFQYTVGVDRFDYDQETIFDRFTETVINHALAVSFDVKQPWGQSGLSFQASQFLDDPGKHSLVLFGDIELRIVRGLSLSLSGNTSRIRDQIFLPKSDATDEEVLVRRQQLATSFNYRFSFGFSYTFGSIFNNVVNPRFGGAEGGRVFFF